MHTIYSGALKDTNQDSEQKPPRLLDRLRQALRVKHYSYRTEQAYVGWIRRFILFHDKRHPLEMDSPEVERFLTWLATDRTVAASTQTQALSALLFLYKHVLKAELPLLDSVRAKRSKRLPVVLSQQEVQRLLDAVGGAHGIYRVMAGIMHGSGVRLMECCRLRVKDIDFERGQLIIREAKGDKDLGKLSAALLLGLALAWGISQLESTTHSHPPALPVQTQQEVLRV